MKDAFVALGVRNDAFIAVRLGVSQPCAVLGIIEQRHSFHD
jgi:hypothetical protein